MLMRAILCVSAGILLSACSSCGGDKPSPSPESTPSALGITSAAPTSTSSTHAPITFGRYRPVHVPVKPTADNGGTPAPSGSR